MRLSGAAASAFPEARADEIETLWGSEPPSFIDSEQAALLDEGPIDDLGELGGDVTLVSSVCTVHSAGRPWQLSFSLPVRTADDLALAGAPRLQRAVAAARRLDVEPSAQVAPQLVALCDPAHLAVRHDGALVEGLTAQLRENRRRSGSDADVGAVGILARDHRCGSAREREREATVLQRPLDEPTWRCAAPLRRRLEDREDVSVEIADPRRGVG